MKTTILDKVDELFAYIDRKYIYNKKDIAIWGTGNTAELYQKCINNENIVPKCYISGLSYEWGRRFHGIPIVKPSEVPDGCLVLVCIANAKALRNVIMILEKNAIKYLSLDAFVISKRKELVRNVFQSLDDDISREIFFNVIQSRVMLMPIERFSRHQYFALPNFTGESSDEVFVDLGAYCGDTIEHYLFERSGSFKKIFAFEPYLSNFKALQVRCKRLCAEWALTDDKIILINGGVGKATVNLTIDTNAGGLQASVRSDDDSGQAIKLYKLDDFFKGQRIDFLKADIESYELDMLQGSENVIKRDIPQIAVAIYHNATDLYSIFNYLKSLKLGYKFAIRHHAPSYSETFLYAWKD